MRVAIASACSSDYMDLAAATNPTRDRYALQHGYAYHFFECDKSDGDACKKDAYFALAGQGYDVFCWQDCDSAVMNPDIKIEDICRTYMGYDDRISVPSIDSDEHGGIDAGCHFLWGWDYAGPNSGVYICRYTPEGKHWMERAYAVMLENGLADETAMETLRLSAPFNQWVRECPGTVMNSYPYEIYGWDKYGVEHGDKINAYRPGSFIMHLPGIPNEKRIEIFRKYGVANE